ARARAAPRGRLARSHVAARHPASGPLGARRRAHRAARIGCTLHIRMPAIVLEHVTKRFGDKVAVSDLSLEIRAGAFVGLLGRNGAGKSTTLKMLTGLLEPTSGAVRLLDRDF